MKALAFRTYVSSYQQRQVTADEQKSSGIHKKQLKSKNTVDVTTKPIARVKQNYKGAIQGLKRGNIFQRTLR